MDLVVGGYQHKLPEGEELDHVTKDGPWCWCAPKHRDLPIFVADREGYAAVIIHASLAERVQRRRDLA